MARGKPKAPAGCYWRGDTLWAQGQFNGKKYKDSLHTDNPAVARQSRVDWEKRIKADTYHGGAPMTFNDAVADWVPYIQKQVSKTTFDRYSCSLNQLAGFVENVQLAAMDAKFIGNIVRERPKAGITNATLKRDLGALSSVMNFAVLHEWKEMNPVLPWLKSVKERRDPIVLPTDEDIALVTKMAPGNWPHLIQAALVTGAREDELVSAKRVQRDLERQTLTVIGKRNKRRTIDLKIMSGLAVLAGVPEFAGRDWLFWRTEDKRIRRDSKRQPTFRGDKIEDPGPTFCRITDAVAAWAEEHGVKFVPFRFHDLRHKHAVDYLKEGRSIYDLQKRLGHSSIKQTEEYLQFLTGDEQRIMTHGIAA